MKTSDTCLDTTGLRVAIVVAKWNSFVTDGLLWGAETALSDLGIHAGDITVLRVPGAFEVSTACIVAARSEQFDAVVVLAAVIQGETPHFEYVCRAITDGVSRAGLETGLPVTFGVLTTATVEHAVARSREDANNKGAEAATAAVEMIHLLRSIPTTREN